MKIAISCVSPLIQSSLNYFLKTYSADEESCDFIITDDEDKQSIKPICLIIDEMHSHIRKPFSEKSLYEDIQIFYEELMNDNQKTGDTLSESLNMQPFIPPMSPPIYPQKQTEVQMETQIREICNTYAKDLADKIIALLKA